VAVADPSRVAGRWQAILEAEPEGIGVHIHGDELERGVTEIVIRGVDREDRVEIGGIVFVLER
jgi:hypothetical protein